MHMLPCSTVLPGYVFTPVYCILLRRRPSKHFHSGFFLTNKMNHDEVPVHYLKWHRPRQTSEHIYRQQSLSENTSLLLLPLWALLILHLEVDMATGSRVIIKSKKCDSTWLSIYTWTRTLAETNPAWKHCPGDGVNSSSGTDGFLKIKEICSAKVTQGLQWGGLCNSWGE